MASLISRVLGKLRGEQPQDAFGGEDLYDGDEPPKRLGRRIALAVSGVMFLLLVGLGVAIYIAGKNAPPPSIVIAPLAGLQVEDVDASSPDATSADSSAPAQTADAVDSTDRSNQRRPWLAKAPDAAAAPAAAQKPAAATPPAATPPAPATTAAKTLPPPAPAVAAAAPSSLTPPAPTTPMPPVTKITPPGAVSSAPVPAAQPAPQMPAAMPSVLTKAPDATPAVGADTQTADATPAMPMDVAPGAPDQFAEKGDLTVGGRPHLAEPALPPVDKTSMSAPPPRFGNIGAIKLKPMAPPDKSNPNPKTGKVAVIVQGLGLSDEATATAITKFPTAVTLSFSPYAHELHKWLQQAKDAGHEVLVEVPMESKLFPAEDPGPLGLMTSLQPKDNTDRLKTILKLFPGAIGIDDIMGSKFRESEAPMRDVFNTLKEGKLVYVQGRPGVRIGEPGVPNTIADIVLDERPFRAAIDARFDYAERLAKYQGSTVTVMGAKPVSFERLALWLDQIDKRGIQLTPVSQVLVQ